MPRISGSLKNTATPFRKSNGFQEPNLGSGGNPSHEHADAARRPPPDRILGFLHGSVQNVPKAPSVRNRNILPGGDRRTAAAWARQWAPRLRDNQAPPPIASELGILTFIPLIPFMRLSFSSLPFPLSFYDSYASSGHIILFILFIIAIPLHSFYPL